MAATSCSHLDQITVAPPDSYEGCEDCLREATQWLHLRFCLSCGHVACCDSSAMRHASAHAREAVHPIVRSAEPARSGAGATWTS